MTTTIAGIRIPDSTMARAATELVRDTEPDLLYNHSRRVFLFGALTGERRQLAYDAELLYIGAMFHDMGLIDAYSSPHDRFEVDGANAARDFLKGYGIGEQDIEQVWDSIALHTTPGIPQYKKPVVALVTAGVGPWLPYEMVGCGFVGLVAGLAGLRRSGPVTWRDIVILAIVGAITGFAGGMAQDFLLDQPKGITALTLTLLGYAVATTCFEAAASTRSSCGRKSSI